MYGVKPKCSLLFPLTARLTEETVIPVSQYVRTLEIRMCAALRTWNTTQRYTVADPDLELRGEGEGEGEGA